MKFPQTNEMRSLNGVLIFDGVATDYFYYTPPPPPPPSFPSSHRIRDGLRALVHILTDSTHRQAEYFHHFLKFKTIRQ